MEIFLCHLLWYNLKVIYKKSNFISKISIMVNVCQFWSILVSHGRFWSVWVFLGIFAQSQLYYEKEDHLWFYNQLIFSVLMAKWQETPLAKNQKRSQMVKNCQYIPVNFGQLGVNLGFIMKRKSPLVLQSIRFLGIDGKMAKKATNQHMAIIILDFFRVKIRSIFFGKQSMTHLIK